MVATTCENSPCGFLAVPLNIKCSRKCASPDLPAVSSAAPTRYQTMWVTTGVRWSGMTTTSRPLSSLKCETSGPLAPLVAGKLASATAITATAAIANRFMGYSTTGLSVRSACRLGQKMAASLYDAEIHLTPSGQLPRLPTAGSSGTTLVSFRFVTPYGAAADGV